MSYPYLFQNAVSKLDQIFSSTSILFGRYISRQRSMRSDRIQNCIALLTVMVQHSLLQVGGMISHIDSQAHTARPMPVSEMARLANITTKTAHRCIKDLEELKLLVCEKQRKQKVEDGQIKVSVCIRRLSEKFWKMVGLLGAYRNAVNWAKRIPRYRVLLGAAKKIQLKIKQVVNKFAPGKKVESVGETINKWLNKIPKNKAQAAGRAMYLASKESKC